MCIHSPVAGYVLELGAPLGDRELASPAPQPPRHCTTTAQPRRHASISDAKLTPRSLGSPADRGRLRAKPLCRALRTFRRRQP
jgi:hypothetical protein